MLLSRRIHSLQYLSAKGVPDGRSSRTPELAHTDLTEDRRSLPVPILDTDRWSIARDGSDHYEHGLARPAGVSLHSDSQKGR